MPPLGDAPHGDYWSSDVAVGTPESWAFDGAEGLARLSGAFVHSSPSPQWFRARLIRVQLDHTAIEAFSATRHRSVRGTREIAEYPTPVLSFVYVSDGSLQVELAGSAFVLHAGQFTVVDLRDAVEMSAPDDVRLLRSTVGVEHVPDYLQRRGTTIPGSLPRTALTESFIAFASAVLRSSTRGRPVQGQQLVQATVDLQNAVLAEAQQILGEPAGAAGLRYRMEEYIEAHLTDRDLGPAVVADALAISVRYAHAIFNDGDRTISRYVRERRLARIALALRTSSGPVDLGELATRYDFPSTESMSRGFTERFGMSPTSYRAGGHQTFG